MTRRKSWLVFPVILCAAIGIALAIGCAKKPVAPPPPVEQTAPVPAAKVEPPKPAPPAPAPKVETYNAPEVVPKVEPAPAAPAPKPTPPPPPPKPEVKLGDVFFAFDKYDLTAESRATLSKNADALKADGSVRILIEGHCDERGTNEYNLGLGERRAKAAKDYLVSLGVDAGRIDTISYGEERPFAQGHDETAWSQNRRGHFVKR